MPSISYKAWNIMNSYLVMLPHWCRMSLQNMFWDYIVLCNTVGRPGKKYELPPSDIVASCLLMKDLLHLSSSHGIPSLATIDVCHCFTAPCSPLLVAPPVAATFPTPEVSAFSRIKSCFESLLFANLCVINEFCMCKVVRQRNLEP